MAEHCSTNCSLVIKTVQNDNLCIISILYEFTEGFTNPILNFTQICVVNISLLLSVISQKMKFGPIHIATWGSTEPCVALWTPEFRCCFFVYVGTHMARNVDIE